MFGLSRIPRPSPALVVAFAALFVAVTGFAIGAIPNRNGVISACYKSKTGALSVLKGHKCPKGSRSLFWNQRGVTGVKGANGAKGTAGAQGVQGAKGEAGTAVAYARVAVDGSLEPGDSGRQNKNVAQVDVEHASTGIYCFGGLPFAVASAMVSPDSAGDINGDATTTVAVQRGITLGTCDAGHQQARVTTLVGGAPKDHRFQIWFEATGGAQIAPGPGGD
ncbi:MAG TPA: hypothetical protein VKV34_02155 [Thermoleophilia bacterium]|nr:hypothetical protein [Thermoleophilia bacterium]